MYNRYLQNSCPQHEPTCPPPPCPPKHEPQPCPPACTEEPEHCEKEKESGSILSLLGGLLGGEKKGGLSKLLDDNTLLILIILFFLLKDDDGIDHDLLILAGVFLLIGL